MNLYDHQQRALDMTAGKNRCAFYVDMGGGKTYIGSEKMWELNTQVNLIVCQKSKVNDWYDHYVDNYIASFTPYDLTNKKEFERFMVSVEMGATVVGIINYDLLFRRPDLMRLHDFTLMLDESSLIQNTSAKRTKFVLKMKPANVILLSGTPTDGKYERLWSQIHLLGWPISKTLYNQTFVIWDHIQPRYANFRIPVVKGYKNVDRLKEKMREYGCVFMKTDEFGVDLPDQQDILIRTKAHSSYKKFMKNRYVCIDGRDIVGDTSLTMRLYARQICGAYNLDKLAAVRDLIESTSDRLIIFYNFNMELEELEDICESLDRPVSVINGSVKDLRAYDQDDNSVTLIQYQAGAYGLNLQKANKIIFFTLPESSEMYEQSRKRTHRLGQTQKCFYYLMITQNSVEELIYKTLQQRKDLTDELFKEYMQNDR